MREIWRGGTPIEAEVSIVRYAGHLAWRIAGPEGLVTIVWPDAEWAALAREILNAVPSRLSANGIA